MRNGVGLIALVALAACGGVNQGRKLYAADVSGIKVGDTTEEVRSKLGPPSRSDPKDRFGREVWVYPYTDQSMTRAFRLYLYFDPSTGKLLKVETGENRATYPDAGR
ncbi:MAG: outer membrane protein assembly factor BamE [Burkholderiales bacterium]